MANVAKVSLVKAGTEVEDVMREIITSKKDDDSFLVMDMTELVHKYNEWTTNLPKIRPFYAVKCNDSLAVIKILSSLGCGFDCASMGEIKKVMSLGVPTQDIIYANPAKPIPHILYAQKVGLQLMTFDSVNELEKIKKYYPDARVVLRIRADAIDASVPLGVKFGCEPQNAKEVIEAASKLQLNLVGFSFHVGTGCKEPGAYPRAIKTALSLIPIAKQFGFNLTLLDIGGGFPGNAPAEFYQVSRLICDTLEEENERLKGLTLIAEPGRYFVSTAYKLATTIVGIRETPNKIIYTVNDSIFGLFNCVKTENIFKIPIQLNKCRQGVLKSSAVWGHTQSIYDTLVDDCLLPELSIGEWVVFDDMGAYTVCLQSRFQGCSLPPIHYMITDEAWRIVSKDWRETQNEEE